MVSAIFQSSGACAPPTRFAQLVDPAHKYVRPRIKSGAGSELAEGRFQRGFDKLNPNGFVLFTGRINRAGKAR
jgi:hypothetical protein